MPSCCVPGCSTGKNKVHALPFTSGLKWKQWLQVCPFLRKYSRRKLENMRICRKHFKPGHIDNVKGRLTMDAIPSLHLPPLKPTVKADRGKNFLEVSPINPSEPVSVKVVASESLPAHAENTFKCLLLSSSEIKTNKKLQARYLVCLKADHLHGLPVDHNMYCLPFPADERAACLFSPCVMCQTPTKELLSNDRTILSIADEHQLSALVDHNVYCRTLQPDASADCLAEPVQQAAKPLSPNVECNMKIQTVAKEALGIIDTQLRNFVIEQEMPDARSTGRESVASQTEDAPEVSSMHWDQLPHTLYTDIEQALNEELGTEAMELLLDSQCGQNNNNVQDTVCVLPTATVAEDCAQTGRQEQSVYLRPNVFNLLTSKSPLEKETLESIHSLFKALKEQHNLPFPTESSENHKFPLKNPAELSNSSELEIQHSHKPTASSSYKQLQSRPAQKQTLESLVAELTESVSAEELPELQPAPAMVAADTGVYLTNPTSDAAPCSVQEPLALDPSYTEIRRVRLDKVYSTPNERLLRMQNNMLKMKLKNLNCRYKKLKSKSDTILVKAKQFIKSYPHFSPEGKLLVDLQVRLARKRSKGARYSEEEKLFAFKLLKIAPEGYQFLKPLLKLPARSTMKEFEKFA